MMPTPEQVDLVMKLVGGARVRPGQQLRDVTIPLSLVQAVARSSLETAAFFPPELCPAELGDGAVIERRGRYRFLVHERFETGQMRFSDLRSRSFFTLSGALRRYLKHYRTELKFRQIRINRWQ
jgi:hypothetical protein